MHAFDYNIKFGVSGHYGSRGLDRGAALKRRLRSGVHANGSVTLAPGFREVRY
jgi:hypothetical protein